MTPTPSAREPQAIAALREKVGNGLREHDAKDILAAYDALAAEREAVTRLAGSLQDDVAALREAEESLTRQRDEAEQRRTMADECLAMIYQKLVQIKGEESMKACPPMFYPEAIHNINADRLRAERERDALRGDAERWRYAREHGMVRVPTVTVDYGPTIYEGPVGHLYADLAIDQLRVNAVRALDGEGRA